MYSNAASFPEAVSQQMTWTCSAPRPPLPDPWHVAAGQPKDARCSTSPAFAASRDIGEPVSPVLQQIILLTTLALHMAHKIQLWINLKIAIIRKGHNQYLVALLNTAFIHNTITIGQAEDVVASLKTLQHWPRVSGRL